MRQWWIPIAVSAVGLLTSGVAPAPKDGSEVSRTSSTLITPDVLRAHVRFLASDLLEGRGPATRGDALTQLYVATQFEALGLAPAAPDGTYFQSFDIVGVHGNPSLLEATAKNQPTVGLTYGKDFIAVAGSQAPVSELKEADLVFVGYGITAPEYQWDDFKGADLKGKVLLIMNNDPEDDPKLFGGKARLRYGRWDYKYEQGQRVGAAGMIIIHTTPSAGYPWQVVQTSWSGEQFELPQAAGEMRMQVKAWATEEVSRKLAALGGQNLDKLRKAAQSRNFRPVPLNVRISTRFENVVQRKRTANILAKLPGSDAKVAAQAVLMTAHHDHLGLNADAKPGEDAVYNGAQDNATGVAALLTLARAYKALPSAPRRTLLFAAVAAEEQGLLGSEFLAAHLPIPAGALAANINMDGLNIWGKTRDVTMIGMGKSSLDALLKDLATQQGRTLRPDPLTDRGFFYRSDQFAFAKLGVPAAYFGGGTEYVGRPEGWGKKVRERWEEKDYHQPSDELGDDWNFDGAVEDTRLMFELGLRIAQGETMPVWNPGDEFENARKKALETVTQWRPSASP